MADSTNVGDRASPRRLVDVTIGSATTISAAYDLGGYKPVAIDWATGSTAAFGLSFQVSQDGTNFYNLYTATGGEVTVASGSFSTGTKQAAVLDPITAFYLSAHRYLKVRAGTAGSAVTLGATAHSFGMVLVPGAW